MARRFEWAIRFLSKALRVDVPRNSRLANALALITRVNRNPELLRVGDADFYRLLAAHNRTARDFFEIACAAREDRRNTNSPFSRERLAEAILGTDLDEGRDTRPRNIQFELHLAAMLRLGGAGVFGGEPDVRGDVAGVRCGFAAKRVRSLSDSTLKRRVNKAVEQITGSPVPGFLAINVDSRFSDVDIRVGEERLFSEFTRRFDAIRYRESVANPRILGAMLFGWVEAFRAEAGPARPRFTISTPIRWEIWCDNSADRTRYEAFVVQWYERLLRNVAVLYDVAYEGGPL
jgi:hypothetical protein